jgi:glycerophosphoryl diester phosphodiesterase
LICIGHRGAAGLEPENTLRSVRRALDLGADGVEIDVRLLDGELIVLHDAKLDRTTNGRGPLRKHSLAEVRALDAGKGERIPLLREVIDAIDRRALLNIELKGPGTASPVRALLANYLTQGWSPSAFLVSSFRRAELRRMRGSGLPVGILFAGASRRFRPLARTLGAVSIHVPLAHATPRLVRQVHAEGLRLFVFTVNTAADIGRMRAMGIDGVFTDFPPSRQ